MATKKSLDVDKATLARKIDEDVRQFLERGGEIAKIETGRSGADYSKPAPKHIKLGGKKKEE